MADFIARLFVFALTHSILALPALQRRMGDIFPRLGRFYRFAYNLVALVTFTWALSAWHFSPVVYIVPGTGSLIFYLIQLVFIVLLARCAAQTGIDELLGLRQMRGTPGSKQLVTTGCYARVRHPLYSLSVVFLALNPVMTLKWLLLTVFSAVYFVIGARIEERRLIAEYGETYRNYQKNVPMFIPAKKEVPRL
ncbi:hypothetical protein GeomeDRAFT_1591 [Geobacter metallireducens RCH3]|uniref:Uncharacterized protein n=1 Tax=Geobacter metallireducens (strain ATCC 53774 / DSM 7210 / GS-15) TaxID=269799 RepID=Q39U65_GEOMG|nr:isoprenylcysteine carboxylmethyltransferase family protein [Geobacter metallireducens]ABB32209.1 hypothetical protein Gmet_1980 [Geobacter metallireducens GS-15]EHP87024.1 hypothetical protein GeomeDRAFT_1591 [Geobacter metallireducens RCH3]